MPPKSETSRSGRRQGSSSSSGAASCERLAEGRLRERENRTASLEQRYKTEIERIVPAVHVHVLSQDKKKKPKYGCIKVSPPRSIEQGSKCRLLPVEGVKQWLSEATSIETDNLEDIIIANFPDGIQASYNIDDLVEYILEKEDEPVAHRRREVQLQGERRSFLDALDDLQISSKEWSSSEEEKTQGVESSQDAATPTRWLSNAKYAQHVNKVHDTIRAIRAEGPDVLDTRGSDTRGSISRDHDYSRETEYCTTLKHYTGSD